MSEKADWLPEELWAEREAKLCDRTVAEYERMAKEWASGSVHAENYKMAMECALNRDVWRKIAWNLRRPRNSRLEQQR